MEVIINFIAEFLLGKTVKAVERWFSRTREEKLIPSDEVKPLVKQRCPFGPVLPSRDYLEAMMGDFLERQQELQKQGGPPRRLLLITMLRLVAFSADVLAITWQNISAPIHNHAPMPPPQASLDHVESDDLSELEIERDD
jgi:hypothetical protein